jgi:hypothetical protein
VTSYLFRVSNELLWEVLKVELLHLTIAVVRVLPDLNLFVRGKDFIISRAQALSAK